MAPEPRAAEAPKGPSKRPKPSTNRYTGHVLLADENIPVVSRKSDLESTSFYRKYVYPRTPVKIAADVGCPISVSDFRADNLEDKLHYDGILQVERKHHGGFGSGAKREKMPLGHLLALLRGGDGSYYLTTQYEANEESGDEREEGSLFDCENENEDELGIQSDEDDKGNDEGDDEGTPLGFAETSSISSIDMNDLHDDFEDENDDFSDSSDPILDPELELSLSEAQSRVKELLQPPLTNLCLDEKMPLVPAFLAGLIPQQINLWMGCGGGKTAAPDLNNLTEESLGKYLPFSPNGGSSSGLHHDHADNLYILIQGTKRFTLFSPADAEKLHTIGMIHRIYENGLIDYEINEFSKNWKHVRSDGAILKSVAEWKLEKGDFSEYSQQQLEAMVNEPEPAVAGDRKYDPPNFSRVPPALLHLHDFDSDAVQKLKTFSDKHFPGFLDLHRVQVWLKPGEMLYLPAGWFHEVTSFGDPESDPIHIALNYWFIPPTENHSENAYPDSYWAEDHARTAAAVALAKKGAFSLS